MLAPGARLPVVTAESPRGPLWWLLSAFEELALLEESDAVARRTVELARSQVGLEHVSVFFVDEASRVLVGAWGTDLAGALRDEHALTSPLTDDVREAFRRARTGIRWSLSENWPIDGKAHAAPPAQGAKRWVVYTPILSGSRPVALMLNDSGASGSTVDADKQALATALCAFLGPLLSLRRPMSSSPTQAPLVASVVDALSRDPSLSGATLARRHHTSLSWLARLFKSKMGVSLVEYRNRLRLERFFELMDSGHHDLLNAALNAGFGSYAQFHRVFRSTQGHSPRDYVRARGSARRV